MCHTSKAEGRVDHMECHEEEEGTAIDMGRVCKNLLNVKIICAETSCTFHRVQYTS